jgi:DNA-binding MarR family transcriptional regulator
MGWCRDGAQLDQELFDAMAEFLGQLLQRGDTLAEQFGVPLFCLKALHRLGSAVTMKELGKQMHCDPSFVTMIADTLEQRGLAKREPNPTDRRLKNLVLTPEGLAAKRRLESALLGQMPWSSALDVTEKVRLLELIRKMTDAAAATPAPRSPSARAGEVSDTKMPASPAAT